MAKIEMVYGKGKDEHRVKVEPVDAKDLAKAGYERVGAKNEVAANENPLKGMNPAKYTEAINACEAVEAVDALVALDKRGPVAEVAATRKTEIEETE